MGLFANAVDSSLGTVASNGILGALLVIALVALAYLYRQVHALQEKRIEATNAFAERLEHSQERDRVAQAEQTKAIDRLAEAVRDGNRAQERNTRALEDHTRAIEGVVRDAVRRRAAASGADHEAIRPGGRDPRRD